MTLMGFIKNRKKFLTVQCGMNVVFAIGNYILGGVSGSIANTVTMIRNVFCLKYKMGRWSKLFFIALQVALTAVTGSGSFVMWLPVIGVCIFTWFMDSENMALLKVIVIASQLMWAVFDYSISNFATVPFDLASVATNSVSLIGIIRDGRETQKV